MRSPLPLLVLLALLAAVLAEEEENTREERAPQRGRDEGNGGLFGGGSGFDGNNKEKGREEKGKGGLFGGISDLTGGLSRGVKGLWRRTSKRKRKLDKAHAFSNLFKMGRGKKQPSKMDWEQHAKQFCELFPHNRKCAGGRVPLLEELGDITKAIERRHKRRHVPRINRRNFLDGVPNALQDLAKKRIFWKTPDAALHAFKSSCRGGRFKCREQPEEAKTRRQLLRDHLASRLKKHLKKDDEAADDDTEVIFDRTLRIKRALLEKANLTEEVDPIDDGVFEKDMLLTEAQSNVLLNSLGKAETDGDEDLSPDEDDEEAGKPPNPDEPPASPTSEGKRRKRAGVFAEENFAQLWPANEPIPYSFDSSIAPWDQTDIRDALAEITQKTCLTFKEQSAPSGYHLNYVKIDSPTFCGLSYIGRVDPVNTIYLSFQCGKNKGVAMHETLHALGVIHQHLRMDRDSFIKMDWENMNPQYYDQFAVADGTVFTSYGVKYDYGSIMHYNAYTAATNAKKPTMIPLLNSAANLALLGQRDALSASDVALVNKMYCKPSGCIDANIYCGHWALTGMCTAQGNSEYMAKSCRKSCNLC